MKKKLKQNQLFIQNFGTYTDEILVMIGLHEKKELLRFMKKHRVKVDIAKWILENYDEWKKEEHQGMFAWNDEIRAKILILRSPADAWDYWEVLMHEIHHVVFHTAKQKSLTEETEAQAYLFEYLFHHIRKKIMNITD